MFYGYKEGEPVDRDDDDIKLLPAIVDKIVIPKLSGMKSFMVLHILTWLIFKEINLGALWLSGSASDSELRVLWP